MANVFIISMKMINQSKRAAFGHLNTMYGMHHREIEEHSNQEGHEPGSEFLAVIWKVSDVGGSETVRYVQVTTTIGNHSRWHQETEEVEIDLAG